MTSFRSVLILIITTFSITLINGQTTSSLEQYSRHNKTSVNGNFLKYHVTNNYAFIEYGNKSFHRSLPEKYDCQTADSWIPQLKYDTHDFMVLNYGCGSPCWGILVLPLDSVNPARNIMYDMAYDSINNLVAYLGCDNYNCLIVENLKTYQAKRIDFPFKTDHEEFIGYWIDSITIKGNRLYYQYSDPNDNNVNKIHTTVTIDLNP
jgi:hypothetical protein